MRDLCIVSDEKNIARIFQLWISETSEYSGTIFTSKQYEDNEIDNRSDNIVIFIGKNKISKPLESIMDIKFDKFGIKYGWKGTRAFIKVKTSSLKAKEWKEMMTYYSEKYEKINIQNGGYRAKHAMIDAFFILIAGGVPAVIIRNVISNRKMKEIKYNTAAFQFVELDGLKNFIKDIDKDE